MTKKNSILMVLAMILILPFAFMLSACNKSNTIYAAEHYNDLKFTIISETDKTVSVGIDEESYDFDERFEYFTGTFKVPQKVKIDGKIYTITKIADYGFCSTGINKFILPNTITEFGYASFAACFCLQQFVIPKNITTIGQSAFAESPNLLEVWNLSNLVITNQDEGEYDCLIEYAKEIYTNANTPSKIIEIKGLKYWPNTKTDYTLIGADSKTTKISNIDSRAKTIGDYAFWYNQNLTSADLTGIQTVGLGSFINCKNLKSVNLTGVQTLGRHAFSSAGIESVDFSVSEITTVTNGAFDFCLSLSNVNLTGIRKIEEYAFSFCNGLLGITLPSTLTEIEDWAFDRTYSLIEVWNFSPLTLVLGSDEANPNKLTNGGVSYYAKEIHTTDEPSSIIVENGLKYWKIAEDYYSLLGTTDKTITTLSNLKANTKNVAAYAFSNCKNLVSADLTGVQYLAESAFMDCENLKTVTLTEENELGYGVFQNCYKLENIDLSKTTSMGNYEFSHCYQLTSVDLRMIDMEIAPCAFEYCKNLESVRFGNGGLVNSETFAGCDKLTTVYLEGADQYRSFSEDTLLGIMLKKMTNIYLLKSIYDEIENNAFLTNPENFVRQAEPTTIGGLEYYLFTPVQSN